LTLAILAAVGLVSLVIYEWFHRDPIIDVHLFKNLNFLGANFMMFILGIMLFSSLVMMPLFLQTLLGYTAESAGLVLSGGGLLLLFLMPVAGALAAKVQARYLIAFGWLALCFGMYYSTQRIDLDISFRSASLLRLVQVFGLGFLFVPINLSSYVGIPAAKFNSVAGLVNFMRNIGSSIGTSMVTTLVARRSQVHQVYLAAHTTAGRVVFSGAQRSLAARLAIAGLDASRAASQAYARLYRLVIGQAATLAYIDVFWVLSMGAGIMFFLSFALRRNAPGAGGEVPAG
jgi:MFS transporter, DHA2 family, multidrug resistance protein